MNKYLASDPLDYLLGEDNPYVRYLALRDIVLDGSDSLEKAYGNLKKTPVIQSFLSTSRSGLPGDMKNITAPGRGSAWLLSRAVALGLDRREPLVVHTIETIFNTLQTPSGGLSSNWKPGHPDACFTGEITRIALAAGINTRQVESALQWISDNQRHDGGWLYSPCGGWPGMLAYIFFNHAGKGLSYEKKTTVNSCMISSISCAMALAEAERQGNAFSLTLKRAANFFLNKKLLLSNNHSVFTPQNIRTNRSSDTALGYPVFCQYDVLYGLIFIASVGNFNHPGTGEAFNAVISQQSERGTLPYENYQEGMLIQKGNHNQEELGNKDKWTTLNFLRLLRLTGNH